MAATEKKLARPPPGVSVPEPTRSGKRRTERHLRQLSCERPTRTAPTRAAAPRAAQLAAAEVEDEDNHMDTDDDDESHLQAAEQHAAEQAAFQARQEARRAELLRDGAEQARCREAEAARLTRATAEEEHRQREAQAARQDRDIKELHERFMAFERTFTSANGRKPTIADLEQPANVRARRDRERYLFLAHGKTTSSLQSNSDKRRAEALERARGSLRTM